MKTIAFNDVTLFAESEYGSLIRDLILRMIARLPAEVLYEGQPRTLEIHAAGISSTGNFVVRAYQTAGYSSRGKLGWGLFSLEKMTLIEEDGPPSEHSLAPRPDYRRGDKQMATILFELVP